MPCCDAFAEREDVGIGGAHGVVDDDAALDREAGIGGEAGLGTDAHRHHHDVGGDHRAVLEQNSLNAVGADDRLGRGLAADMDAPPLQILFQEIARRRIELPLHQMAHQMQHRDIHAAGLQPGGRLEAQKPAADHHGLRARFSGGGDHRVGVVEIAVGHHARKVLTGHRDDEGRRAGGDHQPVVGRGAGRRVDDLGIPVDPSDGIAEAAGDALRVVPGSVMGDDLVEGLLPRQHRRQHDPVVVPPRLGAEEGDVEGSGRVLDQMLQHPARGHSCADHDETLGHHAASFFVLPCS